MSHKNTSIPGRKTRALGADETDAAAYVETAMRGRLDDIAALEAIAMGSGHTVPEQTMLNLGIHPNDCDDPYEAASERLGEMPLCVQATTLFEIVLGTGGPDDRLIVECNRWPGTEGSRSTYEVQRILYRYSWSGSGEIELYGEDLETAEAFARRVVPELAE